MYKFFKCGEFHHNYILFKIIIYICIVIFKHIKSYITDTGDIIEFNDGDIIDIHQTVNGHNLFFIKSLEPLDIRYHYDHSYRYQYDMEELLRISEIEIVGNLYNTLVYQLERNGLDEWIDETIIGGELICNEFYIYDIWKTLPTPFLIELTVQFIFEKEGKLFHIKEWLEMTSYEVQIEQKERFLIDYLKEKCLK